MLDTDLAPHPPPPPVLTCCRTEQALCLPNTRCRSLCRTTPVVAPSVAGPSVDRLPAQSPNLAGAVLTVLLRVAHPCVGVDAPPAANVVSNTVEGAGSVGLREIDRVSENWWRVGQGGTMARPCCRGMLLFVTLQQQQQQQWSGHRDSRADSVGPSNGPSLIRVVQWVGCPAEREEGMVTASDWAAVSLQLALQLCVSSEWA